MGAAEGEGVCADNAGHWMENMAVDSESRGSHQDLAERYTSHLSVSPYLSASNSTAHEYPTISLLLRPCHEKIRHNDVTINHTSSYLTDHTIADSED